MWPLEMIPEEWCMGTDCPEVTLDLGTRQYKISVEDWNCIKSPLLCDPGASARPLGPLRLLGDVQNCEYRYYPCSPKVCTNPLKGIYCSHKTHVLWQIWRSPLEKKWLAGDCRGMNYRWSYSKCLLLPLLTLMAAALTSWAGTRDCDSMEHHTWFDL